jgi:integrase
MATARKLPSGNYRVNLFVGTGEDGKRKYKSFTAPTKKEAELMAAQYNIDRKEKPKCEMTVREAIERYIETKSNVFSPSTVKNYKIYLRNDYKGIEDVKICDLTANRIQKWVNAFAADHSPKTVKNVYYLFVPAIHEAAKGTETEAKLPAPVKYEANIPDQDEIEALFQYFEQRPDYHTAIMINAIMGLRRSETCALEFPDILKNGKLRINKALVLNDQKQWVLKTSKTAAGTRELALPEYLKTRMLELRKDDRTDERIFHFTPNQLTDNLCHARKKLGFDFRLHDLRHYYASVMLSLNIPDLYAMKRMGHSTPTMLKRVYQHLMDEKDREVDDSIAGYMDRFAEQGNNATRKATRKSKNGVK